MNKEKRAHCDKCHRPLKSCLCAHVKPVEIQTPITILQSKDEAKHPFNTAKFGPLASDKIRIIKSDDITEEIIDDLTSTESFLLFKNEHSRPISKSDLPKGEMIVLDGTWKKAKGVYFKWPKLSSIPCYHLEEDQRTIYSSIRKSCGEEHLSTLEAIGMTLKALGELNENSYEELISPLKKLIEQQEAFKK
ncbi:DTW domain-containing protein [Halobacteriovorax sp.]|uniref:DTW domain-containing protein n=1 Tax=Halobacteriovorax sp. TaxID=2020862 RepID=UPI003AF2787B